MSVLESGTWQVVTSEADFLALKDDWDRLFNSNPAHRPFQAWGWVLAWIKHLAGPHEYSVHCWRNAAEELQFVLPLISANANGLYRSPRLMAICGYGPDCSDYTCCLRAPVLNDIAAEITAASIERLGQESRRFDMACVDGSGDFPMRIRDSLEQAGRIVRLTEFAVCPVVILGDSWDDYLQKLSSNFRSQVRRHFKRIANHETLRFESIQAKDATYFTEQLIRLNRGRIGDKGETSSLEDPGFRDFLLDVIPYMSDNGLARMDTIEKDGEIVAAALNLMHGDCVYFYMGGFDRDVTNFRPGTALFARVIMDSIDSGYTAYDFLRGPEHYKYRWGAEDKITYQLDVYPSTFIGGYASSAIDSLLHKARMIVRRLRQAQ